ncbi:unnamed protein product [Rhodiola kirilowii]
MAMASTSIISASSLLSKRSERTRPPSASISLLTGTRRISYSSTKVDFAAASLIAFEVSVKYRPRISVTSRATFSSSLLHKNRVLRSSPSPDAIADLTDEERKCWDSCRQALSNFNFDSDELDKILGKAFGQIHSPYWGEERAKEVPKYETVKAVLDYLRSLTLTEEDLAKILKKFPEVLGCSLDDEVKNNVTLLEKEWDITGKSLKNLLLRNPKVLGYNYILVSILPWKKDDGMAWMWEETSSLMPFQSQMATSSPKKKPLTVMFATTYLVWKLGAIHFNTS